MASLKWMRWLLLISGILVIILGINMLFTPIANLFALAIYIGLSILLSGVAEIASFAAEEKANRSGWLLTSGILSTLLGIWTLFGKGSAALSAVLPFVFAIWVMSSGIMRIVGSFSLKSLGSNMWGWLLALGILGTLLGFMLMFSPMLSAILISYILAFMFISHGVNNIVIFWGLHKLNKLSKQLR